MRMPKRCDRYAVAYLPEDRPTNRPGTILERIALAWGVFTGKCDVLYWSDNGNPH